VNAGIAFNGSKIYGSGFELDPSTARSLVEADERNNEVVFPCLIGKELNASPSQEVDRWAICFHDWPIERAQTYEACFSIVDRLVRPDREKNNRKARRERWWLYGEYAPGLYRSLSDKKRVLAIALTSATVQVAFVPADMVFTHSCGVISYDDFGHFGLLSSAAHKWWAVRYGSTMRTDVRYTPSDVFETFPQPTPQMGPAWEQVKAAGKALDEFRAPLMVRTNLGLTKTYNRVHNPDEHDQDIVRLRELHVGLDYAVRDAYGWSDLELDHHHWETPQGMRFTVSPAAKDELLDRLLELNHERYAEEVAAGLHDNEKGKAKAKPKKSADNQGALEL
jgi:hypothetical protein